MPPHGQLLSKVSRRAVFVRSAPRDSSREKCPAGDFSWDPSRGLVRVGITREGNSRETFPWNSPRGKCAAGQFSWEVNRRAVLVRSAPRGSFRGKCPAGKFSWEVPRGAFLVRRSPGVSLVGGPPGAVPARSASQGSSRKEFKENQKSIKMS